MEQPRRSEQGTGSAGWRRLWPLLPLLVVIGAAWAARPDGMLRVTLLDTRGDAILVGLPDGRFALIDGGGDPARLALLLGQRMPFWQRDLAAVLLTGADSRRLPGQVAALARYRPGLALAPPELPDRGTAGEWRRLLADLGVSTGALRPGQRLPLGGATLRVLAVAPGDEGGAVLLLSYGATRVLVHTGGPAGDSAALAAETPDLLIYPWARELGPELIGALQPRAIAFSDAYEAELPSLLSYGDRLEASPQILPPGERRRRHAGQRRAAGLGRD